MLERVNQHARQYSRRYKKLIKKYWLRYYPAHSALQRERKKNGTIKFRN